MKNNGSIAGNGLGGSAHPGTDSCAVRGGVVLVSVLCDMRSKAPLHRSHDKNEHQTEGKCESFLIGHDIKKKERKNLKNP
jgi:hypothetical protein